MALNGRGAYVIQAAIAALHMEQPRDWRQIAAFIVLYYGTNLIRHNRVRYTAITLFVLAFAFAAIAGVFGALITKAAPVQ